MRKYLIPVLAVILMISAMLGMSCANEYLQEIAELQQQNEELRQQIEDLHWELEEMAGELRAFYQKPFDLSGIEEPRRNHAIEDIMNDSQFWNRGSDVDEFFETLYSILSGKDEIITSYDLQFFLIAEWDCNDMTTSLWHTLNDRGITSIIVVGNLDLDNESFSECNYTWLLVFYKDWTGKEMTIFIVDPTKREIRIADSDPEAFKQYLEGYYYTSPFELNADIEER